MTHFLTMLIEDPLLDHVDDHVDGHSFIFGDNSFSKQTTYIPELVCSGQ